MTVEQLHQLACKFGLKGPNVHASPTQTIRAIQLRRGSEPCFSSEKRYGCVQPCEWGADCRKLRAQWRS